VEEQKENLSQSVGDTLLPTDMSGKEMKIASFR
jgi:hypothetical protein